MLIQHGAELRGCPSLAQLADLRIGWSARRDNVESDWQRVAQDEAQES
jgi:hypothetical protein